MYAVVCLLFSESLGMGFSGSGKLILIRRLLLRLCGDNLVLKTQMDDLWSY